MAEDSNAGWGNAAAAAISALGNYAITAASNKRQFKFQQKAMDKQLEQNKELWDYQNAYNTPEMQMSRLKAAGLNPHLIYGSGAAAVGNAGPIDSPEVPVREVAKPEFGNAMFQYLQARQMDAQYKATLQNIEIAKRRSALMDVQTALQNTKLIMDSARAKYAPDLASAELDTRKFLALRSGELFQNERTKGNVMDQLMDKRKLEITSLQLDNEFKQNRNELAKLGIYSSDDVKWRVLLTASRRMGIDIGELLAQGAQKLKYLFE